ncbi:hypothetical protein L1987_19486 [Smallanthus sonchifolius]|uniref:Uncharacterized protein n=1 Tax=Smallanthus sonchifolius TaxID=185202 RepID=A0ACB9IQU2_9ASTR|nr:hypothetical protein L1987_19486 [Smallanthus sonchifolius]
MVIDIRTLKDRYIDSCNDWSTVPNKAILSAFCKAEVRKSNNEESSFVIFLDDLIGVDFHPLYNVLVQIDVSGCLLEGDSVLLLLHAVNQKLRVVDLQDRTFGKDFLLGLSLGGLACQILNLKFSHFRKVNMIGKFMQMHTLNLDFSASLTTFGKDCFTFQETLSGSGESTDSEVDFSNTQRGINLLEDFTYGSSAWNGLLDLPNEIFPWGSEDAEESWSSSSISRPTSHISRKRHLSYHPSPICYEKPYREYLIASFPNLKVLDNQPIRKADKDQAAIIYSDNFEYLPYKRTNKESVVSILQNRDIKGHKSHYYYSRALGASKVGCAILPSLHPLSITAG